MLDLLRMRNLAGATGTGAVILRRFALSVRRRCLRV